MARIAVGGFQHETNTFAPSPASFADFARRDAWPGLQKGDDLLGAFAGMNISIAGFLDRAAPRHELLPLVWASATPSGPVKDEAFERIAGLMIDALCALDGLDAVYLDLHGAMVTESLEDGEGEILARVRNVVGPDVPIVASLDLHANVSERMTGLADGLVAYRTYPHVDMAATGARAAVLLERMLAEGRLPARAMRRFSFLIPLVWQCTMIEPAAGLYAALEELEQAGYWSLSLPLGFGLADIAEAGGCAFAYADDHDAAERAVATLCDLVAAAEPAFAGRVYAPAEAVARALSHNGPRPVVLADAQDNPGGGADGDTVTLLRALVDGGAEDALMGVLWDPEVAAQAHAAGQGAVIEVALGAKAGGAPESPLHASALVERLSDGRATGTGPFYKGCRLELGPAALLRIGGVRAVVASTRIQAADRAMFNHLGADPARARIVALKSAVHFRADFGPIADEILIVQAPGPVAIDHATLDYKRLRPGLRVMPAAKALSGSAQPPARQRARGPAPARPESDSN